MRKLLVLPVASGSQLAHQPSFQLGPISAHPEFARNRTRQTLVGSLVHFVLHGVLCGLAEHSRLQDRVCQRNLTTSLHLALRRHDLTARGLQLPLLSSEARRAWHGASACRIRLQLHQAVLELLVRRTVAFLQSLYQDSGIFSRRPLWKSPPPAPQSSWTAAAPARESR